ncbi:MAG TPA: glycosyltransferase family 4 protein [Vicinamibacterales bacterium]|nr:glycosyltransferase family 4 protein [Vicinamibacterales bacterium]
MRIVQANAVYDPAARTPAALLDSYRTLTEWSSSVARAGAEVAVVQRFHTTTRIEHDGIPYQFIADKHTPWLSTKDSPRDFINAIAAEKPDVVHVNGLIFPQAVAGIQRALGARAAIVVQHHGGEFPIHGSGLVGWWRRQRWRGGLAAADAISFTSAEQADPWRAAGVLGEQRIIEIVEASTTLRAVNRERARAAVGATGDPLILWVGRLTTNKDPLAVLDGLERALPQLPRAQVMMVFGDDTLLGAVDARVRASAVLSSAVVLSGRVAHDEMPNFYSAADIFVSGSHSEGSGYALIEAMSAGLVPIVTDIPSFRVIAGDCGGRWSPGNAEQLAEVLVKLVNAGLEPQKATARARFEQTLSWEAVAQRTVREYQTLFEAKRAVAG